MSQRKTIEERFRITHARHPEIYQRFKKLTYYLRDERHFTRYSADGIFHVIRFQSLDTMQPDEEFKISNDLISRYVRMLVEEDPTLGTFYQLRSLRAA